MITTLRSALVLGLGASTFAACGNSSNGNNNGGADAPKSIDAQPDAPGLQPGADAIPLTSPDGTFYTVAVTSSSETFALDIDTGSTSTGIAAKTCTACTGVSPLYVPGTMATDQKKTAKTEYADGSGWSGEIFADQVGLGHGTPEVMLDFVSISAQTHFFQGNGDQGIIGLGTNLLLEPGTTSYFDTVIKTGVTSILGFELCADSGTMWLGGFDDTHATEGPQYTPMIPVDDNNPFYSVNLSDMGIGGTSLGFGSTTFQDPIVDTGTSLFYVPTAVQTALLTKVNASAGWKAVFPGQTLSSAGEGCVTKSGVTAAMVDAMLPPLSLTFPATTGTGTVSVNIPASQSYLYDGGGGMFCLVLEDGGTESIMGDTILRAFVTVIDLTKQQIGFALDKGCETPSADVVRGAPHEHGRGPQHRARATQQ